MQFLKVKCAFHEIYKQYRIVVDTGTRFIHGSTLFTYTTMCRDERLKNEKQQCAVFNNETQYVLEVRMGRHGDKYATE